MLRFASVILTNPHAPGAMVATEAVITEEAFALSLGPKIVQQLQLPMISTQPIADLAQHVHQVQKVGPVNIELAGHSVSTHALLTGTGVVIGKPLLAQFTQRLLPDKAGMPPLQDMQRNAPAERILIREGAIDADICQKLVAYANTAKRERAGLVNTERAQEDTLESFVDAKARDTYIIETYPIRELLQSIFYHVITSYVEPFYGEQVEWWEEPQLLSYKDGGKYDVHVDAARWIAGTPGTPGHWQRYMDRDISLLLYLNDTFTGGALHFPYQQLRLQPKPGMLAAFPATIGYPHGAEPTLSGERLVLVSWITVRGSPRVRGAPEAVIYMDTARNQQETHMYGL